MAISAGWLDAREILCIRLDSLGDVLMTSPAIRVLKHARPGRRITLLTSTAGAAVAPLLADIEQTIAYDAPWMKASGQVTPQQEQQMIERLRRTGFDAAVIFTTFSQSPLPAAQIAFLAGIPLRLAFCRENPYQLLTDWLPETDEPGSFDMRHEVRRQLDLVEAAGCSGASDDNISLSIPRSALAGARLLLREVGLDTGRPWIVIHPGASAVSRRYPSGSYAVAAQELSARHQLQILFTGSASEIELVECIRHSMQADSYSLAGRLGLQELSALISMAPLLVSNNSGPVHIAAGVQTPVVDLYALTNPQHTPWRLPHRLLYHDVPCKFCYKSVCPLGHQNCLRLVPPQAVVEAVLGLMAESAA